MSEKYYDAEEHIFYNESGTDVYIKPLDGQTLYVDATLKGSDLVVQGQTETDDLGFNEIYRGSDPDRLLNTYISDGLYMGSDVSMSQDVNYIASACPLYIYGASKGGVSVYNNPSGEWNEYSSLLPYTTFTTEATVNHCSIDETAEWIALTDGADHVSSCDFYRRSGSTWNYFNNKTGIFVIKLSDNYAMCVNRTTGFFTYKFDGVNWVFDQSLEYVGMPTPSDQPCFISKNHLGFCTIGLLYLFQRDFLGTWSNIFSVSLTLSSMDGKTDDDGNLLMACCTTTDLYIFENTTQVQVLSIPNARRCSTNGKYIFVTTSDNKVYIARKKDGVWGLSVNYTTLEGCDFLSCNSGYVSIGTPTLTLSGIERGAVSVYEIVDYENELIDNNRINLGTKDLELVSLYGDITMLGKNVVMECKTLLQDGTVADPSLSFSSDTDTGLYRNATNSMGIVGGGILTQTHSSTGIVNNLPTTIPEGDLSNLSLKFDDDTGIYKFNNGTSFVSEGSNIATLKLDYCDFLYSTNSNVYGMAVGISAQSIPNSISTTLTNTYFTSNTITGDPASSRLSYSNGVFTIEKEGVYMVSYSVSFAPNNTGIRSSRVALNTNPTVYNYFYATNSGSLVRTSLTGSGPIKCEVGYKLSVVVYQDIFGGGSLNTDTGVEGRFIVYRVA